MEPFRSRFNGALSVIGAVVLLIGNTRRAASEFPTATCTAATDGTTADSPCMHKAYLGSTVKIDCTTGYTVLAPTALFTAGNLTMCSEKLPAAPGSCGGTELTLVSQGLTSVKFDTKTYYIPWKRDVGFKGPVKLYGRCAKAGNEALYFGIEFIPRPKFPSTGIFVSCPTLVTTVNNTCLLETRLGDFAVFDCPAGNPPEIVPAQASDKAIVCDADMSGNVTQTCAGASGSTKNLSNDGVTAVMLKNGANQIRTLGYKNPENGTKPAIEGWLNCKGASSTTAFYKYKIEFQASKYKMPTEFTVCDPVTGSDRAKPCKVTLAPGKSYVVNCTSLTKTAPDNLMKSDGGHCTELPGSATTDLCADKKKPWSDSGVQAFSNAGNLVITHAKDNLSSQVKAYGKCFEGVNANYFEITFDTTSTSKAPDNQAFTASRSNGLGIFFGILGFICFATEAFLKI